MTDSATDTVYCANHPQTPTGLRCNKCGKPICTRCAVRTPVGYRCRDCVTAQQQIFETALWYDYLIAAVIAAPVGLVGGLVLANMGFFVIVLSPVVGGLAAEAIRAAVRRRRGRYLPLAGALAFAAGCLPLVGLPLLTALMGLLAGQGGMVAGSLLGLLWPAVYVAIGAATLFARLRGIQIR